MTYDEEKQQRLQRSREYNEKSRQLTAAAENRDFQNHLGAQSRRISVLEHSVAELMARLDVIEGGRT